MIRGRRGSGEPSFGRSAERKGEARVPSLQLLFYALPSLVSSVAALPMALFVPAFYASELGLPLASVGAAIAVSRLLDVITDPLIGRWSDRLHTRIGRRKPWMILGTPLFVVAIWQVFVPGADATVLHLAVWSALLYLGFTMIDLPHKAWGAELSTDYDERSRVTSWREGLSAAGQVALLVGVVLAGTSGAVAASDQLHAMAWVVAIAMPLLVAIAVVGAPEGEPEGYSHERLGLSAGLRLIAANPAFGRMLGCVTLFVSGIAIQGTLHRLVLTDVMGAPERFPMMILVENLATLAAVPLWLSLSVRFGKHRTLMAAALWLAVWSLPLVTMRAGDLGWMMACIAIRGSSFASILFLSNSIAADVIDVDTLASGEQRSGLYFAVWGMATKLSLALGVLLGTALPAAFGYDPAAANASPQVLSSLMLIYGALPALLMASGALFLRGFPITKARHDEVRAELAARGLSSP